MTAQQDNGLQQAFRSRPGTKASDSVLVKPERNYPFRPGYIVDAFHAETNVRQQFPIPHGQFRKTVAMIPTLRAKGFSDIKITNAA